MLDPEQLNARLAGALDVLGGGPRDAPDRQRTLRATIDWSHRLLDAPEAEAFARFAVFAGGATADAAQEVTGPTSMRCRDWSTSSCSCVATSPAQIPGCRCSKPCASTPASGSTRTRTRPRYMSAIAGHYLALVERAEPELFTRGEAEWMPRLDAEVENSASGASTGASGTDPTKGLRLAGLLDQFWDYPRELCRRRRASRGGPGAAGDAAPP